MYYNSAAYDTPTWVEVDEVGDVSIAELNRPAAEVLSRASIWGTNLPGKIRTGIEASYLYGANKTVFDYLLQAHLAKTEIDLAVMDGDITVIGTEGLRLITYVENMPIGQPLEEVSTVDTIRFMAAYSVDGSDVRIDPVWMVVSVLVAGAVPAPAAAKSGKIFIPSWRKKAQDANKIQMIQPPKPMLVKDAKALGGMDHLADYPDSMVVYVGGQPEPTAPK